MVAGDQDTVNASVNNMGGQPWICALLRTKCSNFEPDSQNKKNLLFSFKHSRSDQRYSISIGSDS